MQGGAALAAGEEEEEKSDFGSPFCWCLLIKHSLNGLAYIWLRLDCIK